MGVRGTDKNILHICIKEQIRNMTDTNIVKKGEEKASIKEGKIWSNKGGKKLGLRALDINKRSGLIKGKIRVKGLREK